ncbi:MAG: ATP-binding protein [Chloroflexota bacterium]
MKPPQLFDREREWADLERFASQDGRGIAIVYGRRRQGKSFLLTALAREHGGFYHQALEEERRPALRTFARTLGTYAGTSAVGAISFDDWEAALGVTVKVAAGRPIVIDEFPYLLRKSPELPSAIQSLYDAASDGRQPPFRLILCGSALSVMSGLLTGQRALRGRASMDLLVTPFDHRLSRRFWGIKDHHAALLVDATLGGPPGYRDLLDGRAPATGADFPEWLATGILDPSHALFREAEYLLAEDPALADRALYQTIVGAVARGTSTRGGLANEMGRPSTALEYPLAQLERARMLVRDEDLLRSNRPLLRLADPVLRFDFAVTRPDRARFEARRTAEAWADAEPRFRSQVLGPHFEGMATDWARTHASTRTLGGRPGRVGFARVDSSEEGKGYELDVVVEAAGERVDGRARLLAIGEAKSSERPRTMADIGRLRRLRAALGRRADVSGTKLLLFGRSGFDASVRREARTHRDIELVDLARLYEGD